jgi:serine/threonine protein kinase
MIGEMVSHYRVMERLSLGTLGEVYRAEDTKLKRTVTLKLLPAELCTDEQAKKRFLNEAKAAGSLDHPHIASVHEVGSFSSPWPTPPGRASGRSSPRDPWGWREP